LLLGRLAEDIDPSSFLGTLSVLIAAELPDRGTLFPDELVVG
jgi:hypothetical protein